MSKYENWMDSSLSNKLASHPKLEQGPVVIWLAATSGLLLV